MRTLLLIALLLLLCPASGHGQKRTPAPAPSGVLLIAGPGSHGTYVPISNSMDDPDSYELPADYAVPIACKGGKSGVRGGASCLATAKRLAAIRVNDEEVPVRRAARVAECHVPDGEHPVTVGLRLADDRSSAFRPLTLAVWPASADIGLELVPASKQGGALYLDLDSDGAPERLELHKDAPRPPPPRDVWLDIIDGKDATKSVRLSPFFAASELTVLATTDVDRDGKREIVIHAKYVNDYGVAVIEYGRAEPAYSFNCGNI